VLLLLLLLVVAVVVVLVWRRKRRAAAQQRQGRELQGHQLEGGRAAQSCEAVHHHCCL
jgi:membrane protein implicated in regulation of membrane protease activity